MVNAKHVTNKMAIIVHTTYKTNYDVVHITEAGLGKKLPDYYHDKMVRITDPEEKKIGIEIMHILLDAPPPTNINGVYQETGITNVEADKAHRVLKNKVEKKD